MLIIWTRDDKPQGSVWGRDPKEAALDKETWRVLNAIRLVKRTTFIPFMLAILPRHPRWTNPTILDLVFLKE
jgi:hypothetical protein